MYLISIILPFLSFFLNFFNGRMVGRKLASYLALALIFICFIFSISVWNEIIFCNSVINLKIYHWTLIGIWKVSIGFLFDPLVSAMIFIISIISFFVQIFSLGYMEKDPFLILFMAYLSLFTFFMLFLVTADNLVQLFIGWEGVGVCSYLLINFWSTRLLANKAALKAMIINRISDVIFIFAIALVVMILKSVDYKVLFSLISLSFEQFLIFFNYNIRWVNLLCFFFFIGAVGKSAQIGLHTWLPDAMEGPTPVSALLHAATMVTAGVFLILRFSFIFEYSQPILFIMTLVGGLTSFFFASVSCFQYDIKKIIAYSTCSQLGYMFFACGLSQYQAAFFHLLNHAFFKALLFLGAGSIIHALNDEQDIRKMGNLSELLPLTYISFFIASLSIIGFPFLSGFYSKDLILELTLGSYLCDSFFIYFLSISAALCTSIYSARLIIFVFFWYTNQFNKSTFVHEGSIEIFLSIFLLAFLSIFSGFFFFDLFGWGWNFFFISPTHLIFMEIHYISPLFKNLVLILSFIGIVLTSFSLIFFIKFLNKEFSLFSEALFINGIYNGIFIKIFLFSYKFTKLLDKGFLEYIGPFGTYKWIKNLHIKSLFFASSIIFFNLFFTWFFLFFFIFFIFIKISYIYIFGFFFLLLNEIIK